MNSRTLPQASQLGFNGLLAEADTANERQKLLRAYAHLPGTYREAVPFFRSLIDQHHAAMLAGDAETAMRLRTEADRLATKLNNFQPGILADANAPGCVLDRVTRAPKGTVPLWGQSGSFEIDLDGMRVRIAMDGIFGLASNVYHWLGFAAYAVDRSKPFLSETGYRSFIAIGGELVPGFTPDRLAREAITAQIKRENKGRLLAIKPEYRARKRRAAL
jgi:hypothetical protein